MQIDRIYVKNKRLLFIQVFMVELLGSYDFYEDPLSNFCVTLMCDYKNNLVAVANKLSRLPILRQQDEPIFLDLGDGEGFWFNEFDENLLAKDGYQISFIEAIKYFPYLQDHEFWNEEKWSGYSDSQFNSLLLDAYSKIKKN